MSSTKGKEISSQPSEIAKFFSGKSVFITGAAGFLGVVLLEILLRCCLDIRRLYILLREKKGVLPQDRKRSIFERELFSKLREKNPDVFEKVIVVPGDIVEENLGMSEEDLHRVTQDVSIVFHCAACISFKKPLRFMVQHNFIATINIIEFCRKLKTLDALIYTSTAYSNAYRKYIEEKIYELPFSTDEVLDHYRNNREAELMNVFSSCNPKFQNFYLFTKCLAEKILEERASDLPVAIVRPCVILCSWKGVLPGYVERGSGILSLCEGVGKGFIRVHRLDTSQEINYVPVDFAANTLVVAAWSQATHKLASPIVYNCVLSPFYHCTWAEFIYEMLDMAIKTPLPNSYQKPGLSCFKNPVMYWFHSILDHYVPAVVIDALLWLSGRKPRLLKLYRLLDSNMPFFLPFVLDSWEFSCENYKSLSQKLNDCDAEMFPLDMHGCSPAEFTKVLPSGAPMYRWETDTKSPKERVRSSYLHYLLTRFIKWSFLGTVGLLLYVTVSYLL